MKEVYKLVEIELIRLQTMDAIANSPNGGLDEDELPGFGVNNQY